MPTFPRINVSILFFISEQIIYLFIDVIWDCPYKSSSEKLHYIPTPAVPRAPDEMQTLGISIPAAPAFCRMIFLWNHNIWELWTPIAPSAGSAARKLHGLGVEFTKKTLQGTYT